MFGPWPQRAIVPVALAAAGFVVVLLPWTIAARCASAKNTNAN
jgi:hypothetical protein